MSSLPVWGEWIEMPMSSVRSTGSMSLPVWGEWIEILKAETIVFAFAVSPRVGRVD